MCNEVPVCTRGTEAAVKPDKTSRYTRVISDSWKLQAALCSRDIQRHSYSGLLGLVLRNYVYIYIYISIRIF